MAAKRIGRDTGGQTMSSDPGDQPISSLIRRGQPLAPRTPHPTPEQLAAARADTRTGGDVVNQRLNTIVPEHERVAGGTYTPGAPGGGRWSDIPEHILNMPGTGFNVHDHELHHLWNQSVAESSEAAKRAVSEHGVRPTFYAKDWDQAMRLPIRDQLWYELSGEKLADNMPDLTAKEHMHHMDMIGATSARAAPGENLERSLGALSQSMRGRPVDVDLTIPKTVQQALSRKGSETSALPGNKTGHFSDTLALAGGIPTRFPISVNDVWVGKMFGVPDDVMSGNQSLHEPMAKYFNKIRDLYNERHGHESPFPHQSWNFQAPAWVHLRAKENNAESGDAYHQVWPSIIQKLNDAGIPGVNGQQITRQALMHPGFADALRRTTGPWREAPKATIEFGTKLTPAGARARELYDHAVKIGDTKTQDEYLKVLTSAMYHSARGKNHPWERLKKAITGDVTGRSDITRIVHPTSENPLDTGGTFEGDLSPNIRVPLSGMSPDQIRQFNAVAGTHLNQAAMATSKVTLADHSQPVPEDHIRGHSLFVPTTEDIHPDDIKSFAGALHAHGHDMSYTRYPNGYQFDVLPNFNGDVPKGANQHVVESAYHQSLGSRHGGAEVIPHDFKSMDYSDASDYGLTRAQLIRNIQDDFIQQARSSGLDASRARAALKQSDATDYVVGKSKRAWLNYRARLDHLSQAEAHLKGLAQTIESGHQAFIAKAEKRMARQGKLPPSAGAGHNGGPPLDNFARGGAVDRALKIAAKYRR
jgi:hypothetical protein